jgi:hypothetical protein
MNELYAGHQAVRLIFKTTAQILIKFGIGSCAMKCVEPVYISALVTSYVVKRMILFVCF